MPGDASAAFTRLRGETCLGSSAPDQRPICRRRWGSLIIGDEGK